MQRAAEAARIVTRRVAGYHDIRLDGMTDLVPRARGASVLDIGCNRGMVGFELASNGAVLVHGCDIYEPGVLTAREVFADLRAVQSQFEVVDLSRGAVSLSPFGSQRYDIVLMLATYHKLKRVMEPELLTGLMRSLGKRTSKYFAWRGTSEQIKDNRREMKLLDEVFAPMGLYRVHTSAISETLGLSAIWRRDAKE